MKTYPTYKPDGKLAGFEIDNIWISFNTIYKILKSIEGIQDIQHQFKSEVCFVFNFKGNKCVINEPPGQKERFWIGLKDNQNSTTDILPIHKTFQEYKQPKNWIIKLLSIIVAIKIEIDNKKKPST